MTENNQAAATVATRRRVTKVGIVASDKMDKTVVVRVDRTVVHKRYRRYIRKTNKFMAHDESNECKIGDTVEIVESRPLSAHKRWRVRRILRSVVTATPKPKAE